MQAIITSAAIVGGSIWAFTENHGAWSRVATGAVNHVLRAIGFV